MKKFKGQGTFTKAITSKIAQINRDQFKLILKDQTQIISILHKIGDKNKIELDVIGFSSSHDLAEQVLSILSFIKYVGTPNSWIIYSDGSHTASEINLMQDTLPFVKILKQDINEVYLNNLSNKLYIYKDELEQFAENNVLGKRLCLYLNHPINKPTLFLDSDILFYSKATLLNAILNNKANGWFLPDQSWGCLHSEYTLDIDAGCYQVNAGFLLINKEFANLDSGLQFLKKIGQKYEYFTEQTIIHIISQSNQYMPFDPRSFVVNTSDQFDFSYAFDRNEIAMRHYTGPVRHKMWQRNWKWHLSLS